MTKKDETRSLFIAGDELRVVDAGEGKMPTITGYAAVWNSLSDDLGGFRERIMPGAFSASLAPDREVLALVAHDTTKVIGRRSVGTLNLREDNKGLKVEIFPPNTTDGKDAVENVRAKNFKGMSFRFNQANDEWSRDADGGRIRTIKSFGILREVSVTGIPAYDDTTAELRDKLAQLDRSEKLTPRLDAARRKLRLMNAIAAAKDESRDMDYSEIASRLRYAIAGFRSAFDVAQTVIDMMNDVDATDLSDREMTACVDCCDAAGDAAERINEMLQELAPLLPADAETE